LWQFCLNTLIEALAVRQLTRWICNPLLPTQRKEMSVERENEAPTIFEACESGDLDTLRKLIESNPELVHEQSETEDQPLHVACLQKHDLLVKYLIDAGADVNGRGDFAKTPLHYAVFEGDEYSTPIVKLLLDAGADPNLRDKRSDSTPLKWAQREHHEGLDESIALLKSRMD
jgi:ankyrin repeat protein